MSAPKSIASFSLASLYYTYIYTVRRTLKSQLRYFVVTFVQPIRSRNGKLDRSRRQVARNVALSSLASARWDALEFDCTPWPPVPPPPPPPSACTRLASSIR